MNDLAIYLFNLFNKNYPWFLDFINWRELENLAQKLQKEKKLKLYGADWVVELKLVGNKIRHKAEAIY